MILIFSKRLNDYGGIRTGEFMSSKSGSTCYTRLIGCKEICASPREVAEPFFFLQKLSRITNT